jgi:hypothetical protein
MLRAGQCSIKAASVDRLQIATISMQSFTRESDTFM